MKKQKTHASHKARAASHGGLNLTAQPDAAGIDIAAQELVVAVPPGRCEGQTVRSFICHASLALRAACGWLPALRSGSEVEALRDWLLECKIATVAIESTGNYWITCYSMLEDAGIDVCLVNARHVKGVPGKKTDVCDAQWLQQLHSAGLLKKSFRPARQIAALRYLMRHRGEIIAEGARQVQLMQKVLTEPERSAGSQPQAARRASEARQMNLHIAHVFSDVDGVSAQAIISAILAGERDAAKLAALRDKRCRSPLAKIIEALKGGYRPEYLFVLGQCQKRWAQCNQAAAECDEQIAALIKAVQGDSDAPPPSSAQQPKPTSKNAPAITPIQDEAFRFYGVDLAAIPGIGSGVLSVLMSELGTGSQIRKAFRSAQAFASWMGLCPDNRISGGKVLKAKTRKVPNRVARVLRMAAFSLSRSKEKFGEQSRRLKARLGKAEGIVAVAHKLARVIYGMITTGKAYNENEAFKQTPVTKARRLKYLIKQAQSLGYTLAPAA